MLRGRSIRRAIGNDYDLDVFFAERHTSQSNSRNDTSIALKPTPEPATMLLVGSGLKGLAGIREKIQ